MSTLLEQFKKVQPCDGRGMIQILIQILTQEVLELKSKACTNVADIFTQYGIENFSPCEDLTEEFLQEIQSGDPITAINTLLATLNYPPHILKVLTQGFEGLSQEEEQEVYEWILNTQQIQTHPATARYVRYNQNREHTPVLTAVEERIVEDYYIQQGIQGITEEITARITEFITSKVSCPTQPVLTKLINITNNLVSITNIFQNNFEKLQTAVNISSSVVATINIIIDKAKVFNTANDITIAGLTASGVGAAATGPLVQAGRIIDKQITKYEKRLEKLEDVLCNAVKVVQFIAIQLSVLRALLQVIDAILRSCLQKDENGDPLRRLNEFTADVQDLIQYNGYKIEIRSTPESTAQLPQRYAVAIDEFGVVVLQGPVSYSSSTAILVQEIKFRIDNQLG